MMRSPLERHSILIGMGICLVDVFVEENMIRAGWVYAEGGLKEVVKLRTDGRDRKFYTIRIPESIQKMNEGGAFCFDNDYVDFWRVNQPQPQP